MNLFTTIAEIAEFSFISGDINSKSVSAEKQQFCDCIHGWLSILDCYLLHKVAITKCRSRCRQIYSTHVNKKKQKLICETFENWKGKTNQNIAFFNIPSRLIQLIGKEQLEFDGIK